LLAKSVGASRFVFNWGLAESRRQFEISGKRPQLSELKKKLVQLKKKESPWLYEISAHISQSALVDLDRAFDAFFKGLKGEGPRNAHPKFKHKYKCDSARLYEVTLEERHIRLPRIGRVRLKETRSQRGFDGRILSGTIRRRADRWFISLTVERERELAAPRPIARSGDVVGVDLGLTSLAVVHDGNETSFVEPQRALRDNLVRLRRLDRRLSRKQKGSRNHQKARLRRARLYYRVSCQRQAYLHQLSSSLAKTKSVIVLEDLHLKGMQRYRSLSLSLGDAALGELRRQIAYKSQWYGSTLIVVDQFFPSSKLCSGCGFVKDAIRLSERVFRCDVCGVSLDRDENAAINLRRAGLGRLPEGLREVTPVERKALALGVLDGVKPASQKQEATARGARRVSRRSTPKGVLVRPSAGTSPP
jgi:putative transposase